MLLGVCVGYGILMCVGGCWLFLFGLDLVVPDLTFKEVGSI